MKKIYIYLLMAVLFSAGCDKDDFTGYSTLKPTSPEITVTFSEDLDDPTIEEFEVTVTMDVAQVVDVKIYAVQTGGDAELHEDYDIEGSVTIPAGETEGVFTFVIHTEELYFGPRTLTMQIGDERTANAEIEPVTFTIDRD